ncbi:hypothetical protein ATE84_2862 [Aquimarina sp. MAR_2010_214]|uniref:hypothetical protein n=1 Tax=Aquimarina sp. MAR_2010_214 TaxID=1250026 RepID=UPI000C7004D0|nr:hypothetical protein [Aquimarina sp. MAR_2010_214]PKV50795.1 hypothetical protein ATE84_2862 [Aquimarina sp. MAR_2010_214]
MREQIWATLNDLKFKGYCLELVVEKFQKWDRNVNIFLAITSSGSIGAWAVWQKYPMIWAGIIVISQVLTVIKPFFPYFKYVKELSAKRFRIENLNIEVEQLWYKLQNGKIGEDEAAEDYFEMKKQIAETFNFNDDTIFNVKTEIVDKANNRMKVFLKNNYNIEIDINS